MSEIRYWSHLSSHMDVRPDARWGAPAAMIKAPTGFGEDAWIDDVPDTIIAFHIEGAAVHSCLGRGARNQPSRKLALQAKGTPNHYLSDGPVRFAQIALPDDLLDRATSIRGVARLSGRLRDDLIFPDAPALHRALEVYIRRAFDQSDLASGLEMEGLALLLLDKLIDLHGPAVPAPMRGGLTRWQARRVLELLESRLSDDISLAELSLLVGLSPNHFCTAFRISLGEPPHRWLVRRRIERAKEMLADRRLSVTEVALAVGFGSSAHFATAFRKEVGVTPTSFRRERLL